MTISAKWFMDRFRLIWWVVFTLSVLPAINLYRDYSLQQLGENPLQALSDTTGRWALIYLLITLAITPLRQTLVAVCIYRHAHYGKRLEDWNWIIRLRRMLGLYSFFYASLHMLIYTLFDAALQWQWIVRDLGEKPYIILGMVSFLILLLLAITSHGKIFQLMGKHRWQLLHRSIYLLLILVLIHFWWQSKVGIYDYINYALVGLILLGFRLLNWLGILNRSKRDDGMETPARSN